MGGHKDFAASYGLRTSSPKAGLFKVREPSASKRYIVPLETKLYVPFCIAYKEKKPAASQDKIVPFP